MVGVKNVEFLTKECTPGLKGKDHLSKVCFFSQKTGVYLGILGVLLYL